MDFESRIWQFCRNVHVCLENMFEPLLEQEGLNFLQAKLLFVVFEKKELSVGELSALIRMNTGNCSTMCKKLESMGLLHRERKQDDERVVVLRLAPRGAKVVSSVFTRAETRQKEYLAKMSEQERSAFLTQLADVEKTFLQLNVSCFAQQEGHRDGK